MSHDIVTWVIAATFRPVSAGLQAIIGWLLDFVQFVKNVTEPDPGAEFTGTAFIKRKLYRRVVFYKTSNLVSWLIFAETDDKVMYQTGA